jgi:hypothetical protein
LHADWSSLAMPTKPHFTVVGLFVVQAALHHDPSEAQGMGAAFQKLAPEPTGHFIVGVVALGFIALGLHSLACARWIRMLRT